MSVTNADDLVAFYDTHPINEDEILTKVAASGCSLDSLTTTFASTRSSWPTELSAKLIANKHSEPHYI